MTDEHPHPPGEEEEPSARRRTTVRIAAVAAVAALAVVVAAPLCISREPRDSDALRCGRFLDLVDDIAARDVRGTDAILARVTAIGQYDAGTELRATNEELVDALRDDDSRRALTATRRLAFACADIAER